MTPRLPPLLPTALVTLAVLLALQAVPYRVHNPPVVQGPAWDSPETEALARRACFDCHSNEVRVPWYGKVAPSAWIVRNHVDEGRAALNFSEMHRPQHEAHEAGEKVEEGEMPPGYYTLAHAEARLTDAETRQLVAGLNATLGGESDRGERHAAGERRDVARDEDSDSD